VEDNERDANAISFFAQNRIDIGKFSLTPGVRFESINLERRNILTGARGKDEVTEVIPALSAAYAYSEALTVFAGVHEGFAPPRVEDLITNAGGSVDLDAEQSVNIEAGLRTSLRGGLRMEATYFRNDFDNQIAVGSVAGGDQPLAQGETLYEGSELFARLDSAELFNTAHNVYLQAAWTWTWEADQESAFIRVDNRQPLQGNTQGNRLPYAPEHLFTGTVGYAHPAGWDVQLETVFVDEQFADFLNLETPTDHPDGPASVNARSGQFGKIDSYTVLNFAATYTIHPYNLDIFFTVKNLLDDDYIVDRTRGILPGAPRLLQAGLKYAF
jgi:Fe(3+) dicitrate transport protein